MTKQASRFKLGRNSTSLVLVFGIFAAAGSAVAQSPDYKSPSPAFTEALTAFDAAWTADGLAFSSVTFTDGPGSGYGKYTATENNVFSAGETIALYAQPVGYAFDQSQDGYTYKLAASYRLINTSGQVLSEQSDFAEFTGTTRSKQRQLSASLSFQFDGLPEGDYALEATFADQIGNQTAGFKLPFTIKAAN
ncbi:hypothetical protein [Roseibium sp.]|uniref:hypothetical protein n=1 Tax=Roseibium sp. TaxID=1936156 RepID=UPI003B5016FE